MKSLGVSEVVNKETLSLFRCSEGHQMWLTDEELDTKTKKVVEIVKSEVKPETARCLWFYFRFNDFNDFFCFSV